MEGVYLHRFSVGHGQGPWHGAMRTVVRHEGHRNGDGKWRCSKDGTRGCTHVDAARRVLRARAGKGTEEEEEFEVDVDLEVDEAEGVPLAPGKHPVIKWCSDH